MKKSLENELEEFITAQGAFLRLNSEVQYYNGDSFNHIYDLMAVAIHFFELGKHENNVTSFFYYMWNKWSKEECRIVFADSCGGYEHYWNKWCHYFETLGVRSAVDCLYADLDKGNRDKLVARALECYDGMKEIK